MYKVKGRHTVEVDCIISKRQVYFIIQEEYYNLLRDNEKAMKNINYFRKDDKVYCIDHSDYFPSETLMKTLTEKELADCIALERVMDYFNNLVYKGEE